MSEYNKNCFLNWITFQVEVWKRIEVVDKQNNNALQLTVDQCILKIKQCLGKHDFINAAHYAQMAWSIENDTISND